MLCVATPCEYRRTKYIVVVMANGSLPVLIIRGVPLLALQLVTYCSEIVIMNYCLAIVPGAASLILMNVDCAVV